MGEWAGRRAARYAALGLLGLLGLAGVVLLVWRVPPALYGYVPDPKDRAAAEASTRTGLIAGLAGLAALGGLATAARTYRLTEQGHITDRYTKAIEQLGDDRLTIRLGGIYALERIAVDSERDHPTVVEVLGAFVRESTAEPPPDDGTEHQPQPATDVQAALTVLGRLPKRPGVSRGDLIGAHLSGAQLDGADLSGAGLHRADLSGAWLHGADLSGAGLRGADLSGAMLTRTDLTQAQLDAARGDAATFLPDGLQRPAGWAAGQDSAAAGS
jgi:hypothetical protein